MCESYDNSWPDFTINTNLTNTARNQLCVLGPEIKDQYPVLVNILCHINPVQASNQPSL